jgi:hypothetical protein
LNNTPSPSAPPHGFSTQATDRLRAQSRSRSLITRNHDTIQRWAARHGAEPATGEATASGPATVAVNDRGAGIRFNFPGAAFFRPITWDEWFANFEGHELAFAMDEEVADRAYEIWEGNGGGHGRDRADWFEAERQLGKPAGGHGASYRLIKRGSDTEA